MNISPKERKQAYSYLQAHGIDPQQIDSFTFMRRHTPVPHRHSAENRYGSGLLTVTMRNGSRHILVLHLRHHPSAIIRTLVSMNITFSNLQTAQAADATPGHTPQGGTPVTPATYRRPSLYRLWYFALFIASFSMGIYFLLPEQWAYGAWLSIPFYAATVYLLYLLQTRFCYLSLSPDSLTIHSLGRSHRFAYSELRKVNFDFAREQGFTHVMELLTTDYYYHLYYIGRTPRKSLNQIAQTLRQAGIDATCSLNDEKRHYEDVYHEVN